MPRLYVASVDMVASGLAMRGEDAMLRENLGERWHGVSGLRLRLQRGHGPREAVRVPDKRVRVDGLAGGQFRLQEFAIDRQRGGRAREGLGRLVRLVAEIAEKTAREVAESPR